MAAACFQLGNRAGDFIGVHATKGRGLREFSRLTIRKRGMRAAFIAPGEALIDAVAVSLVGDNVNTGFGRCWRGGGEKHARKKGGNGSHDAPMNERIAPSDRPKKLRFINRGGTLARDALTARPEFSEALLTRSPGLAHGDFHVRLPRHLRHLP